MCVKLKPESMINMHSGGGGGSPLGVLCGAVNNEPWGVSDAAIYEGVNPKRVSFEMRNARTGTPVVGLEFVFLKDELVIDALDLGEVEIRFSY